MQQDNFGNLRVGFPRKANVPDPTRLLHTTSADPQELSSNTPQHPEALGRAVAVGKSLIVALCLASMASTAKAPGAANVTTLAVALPGARNPGDWTCQFCKRPQFARYPAVKQMRSFAFEFVSRASRRQHRPSSICHLLANKI